ncbi:MAG: MFS transporter [Nitratireductor sp.]|nr:MFS transporter [Nitratireductor sp.]
MSNASPSAPAPRPATGHAIPWPIVLCGCLIAMLTFGPRSAMGFYQLPVIEMRGWDRTTFGLAIAIQNLFWGAGQPVFGAISDKFGTWRVLALGAVIYAAGLYLMSVADAPWLLHLSAGVMIGLGVAAGSFSIVMAAFARNVSPEHRTTVFGIGTAAGSAGMAFFSPLTVALIASYGWQDSLVYMAALMLLIPLLALPLVGNAGTSQVSAREMEQTVGEALREALGHQSYRLLVAGFFVCGFQVAFITAHFPAYLQDIGIDAYWAGIALLLIGGFNIIGSLGSGVLSKRRHMPHMLALIYVARSIAVTAFLLLPQTPASVVVFAAVMGILWLSTVPPTNALVAVMFGTRYLGMLGGIVFLSHQVGSFLGVWLGGYLFDLYGTFDPVWWLGVALGLFAAIVHWPIRQAPVERLAAA